jgi:phosphate transport system permease protein
LEVGEQSEKETLPLTNTRRKIIDRIMTGLVMAGVVVAVGFLIAIIADTIIIGAPVLNWTFLSSTPLPIGTAGGGIGPEIEGTFIMVGLGTLISVPIGVFAGVFFSEWPESRLSFLSGFANDVLAEFPSMVIGIFVYLLLVLYLGTYSGIAGAVALAIIMIPIVARTTDESLKLVPRTLREASIALGVSRWRTVFRIVIGTGKAGLATGILLAIARATGETAPLIITSFSFVATKFSTNIFQPMSALPVLIWLYGISPFPISQQQAWGAALLLIIVMLALNLSVKFVIGRKFGAVRAEI